MTPPAPHPPLGIDTCVHIYTISATMIGVLPDWRGPDSCCHHAKKNNTLADGLLCLDAVLFLFATIGAYWILRSRGRRRLQRLELAAVVVFVTSMGLMAGICGFITYAISI